jgi:HEAT repeat protein
VIRRHLKVFTVDEILEEAKRAKTRDDWIYVAYELAAAAPGDYDPRVVQVLERALESESPDVRRAAIIAMGYLEWPQLRPLLERVREKDPDPAVHNEARVMLEGLETRVWH